MDYARNCLNGFHQCVDVSHALVEIPIPEHWSLKGQELLTLHPEIGVAEVAKGLEHQAAARQEHHGQSGLDDDQRMLEPMATRACGAAPSLAQSVLLDHSRSAQRRRESEGQCGGDGYGGGKGEHAPVE